jgi:hypothetical protein
MKYWMYCIWRNNLGGKSGGKLGGNGAVGWAACGRWASISTHVDTRALCENRKVAFCKELKGLWGVGARALV